MKPPKIHFMSRADTDKERLTWAEFERNGYTDESVLYFGEILCGAANAFGVSYLETKVTCWRCRKKLEGTK